MYFCVCMCAMNKLKLLCPFQKKIPYNVQSPHELVTKENFNDQDSNLN